MTQEIRIVDDGTLDTVVLFMGREHRYDSEFRFSFDSDDEFLEFVELELSAEFLRHRKLRQDMDAMFAAANKRHRKLRQDMDAMFAAANKELSL